MVHLVQLLHLDQLVPLVHRRPDLVEQHLVLGHRDHGAGQGPQQHHGLDGQGGEEEPGLVGQDQGQGQGNIFVSKILLPPFFFTILSLLTLLKKPLRGLSASAWS